jgi:hypothetical protein
MLEDEDSKIIHAKVDPFFGNKFEYNGYLIGTDGKNETTMTVKN